MSENFDPPTRRDFCGRLGWLGMAALGMARMQRAGAAEAAENFEFAEPENLAARGEIPRRKFGKTGEVVSAIGLGGHTFALA